ncbi:hypothetical protein FRC01_008203 [Tulasnella sp. 417]|nr:hypothetical protein FRC01_008203 [Tulasnella sp. 417]
MESLPLKLKVLVFGNLRKDDLLSSALVCRAWRGVAWDEVMWKTFTIRLSGLLETLLGENDLYDIDDDDIIPFISSSDPKGFLAVAAKATSIRLDVALFENLIKALSDVANSAPGNILFPVLHTLDWGEFDEPPADLAHTLFTGSPIKRIRWDGGHFEGTSVASRKLLSSLLLAHPQIQDVAAIEDHRPESTGTPEFWRLPDLRSLRYDGRISYEEWTKLIQGCPKLDRLELKGCSRASNPTNRDPLLAPSLRELTLPDFWSSDLTIAILGSTNAPHLRALYLDGEARRLKEEKEHPNASRARTALRMVAERSKRLEILYVQTSIELGVEFLAAFSSLKRLRVTDTTPDYQMNDSDIESLCPSLPLLSNFDLYCSLPRDGDCPKITPKSFGSFARHCKQLASLGLPVAATNPEDYAGSILTELVPFGENLKHLSLTTLAILADRQRDFVSFLIVQCPKLTSLSFFIFKITDQKVSTYNIRFMIMGMRNAYFKAQAALEIAP